MKRPKIPPNPKDLFASLQSPTVLSNKPQTAAAAKPAKIVDDFRPRNTISISGATAKASARVDSSSVHSNRNNGKVKPKKKVVSTSSAKKEKPTKKIRRVVITPDLKALMVGILQQVASKTPVKISSVERRKVRTLLTILGAKDE
jgi:hypothetical protein